MILTSYGIRLPLFGDGETTEITIDLRDTMVLMGAGEHAQYRLLPLISMPHVVIDAVVGGPSITPETHQNREIEATLSGYELHLVFPRPLLKSKEAYTVEIIFGRMGRAEPEPAVQNLDI